eukprot:7159455-Lingulodinium_polyedra.AAC.1
MDFMDILAPKLRYFNVCRAKTGWNHLVGIAGTCGYAFPQKMWYQFPGLWKYKRLVCWGPLVQEAQKRPEEKMLNEWVENL